jgi:hypothetical protein
LTLLSGIASGQVSCDGIPNRELASLPLYLEFVFLDLGVPGSLLCSENVPFDGVFTLLAILAL